MIPARRRIEAALRTWPDRAGWNFTIGAALPGLALIGLIAWAGGLARFHPLPVGMAWLRIASVVFVLPALAEELIFRALLVPRPDQEFPAWRAIATIALFVGWHPFQALTFGPPWSALFLTLPFLGAVVVLGATLTAIYRKTGSIWPCVAVHWLLVMSWKLLFGGPF
ncbi:MAG: CPBP family glutamic-type intramembrane protease [Sphingomonas sp.]